jgi:hypothetical protein
MYKNNYERKMTTYPWKAPGNPDSPHLICVICAHCFPHYPRCPPCRPCCPPSTYPHRLVVVVPRVLVLVAVIIVAPVIRRPGSSSHCPHVVVDLPCSSLTCPPSLNHRTHLSPLPPCEQLLAAMEAGAVMSSHPPRH